MSQDRKRFDARPDRLDLGDRRYRPPLRSLPDRYPSEAFITQHLDDYMRYFILDQGGEGACTGFGLACLVNYLLWRREVDEQCAQDSEPVRRTQRPRRVSPRMLYQLARAYDEWAGEDYEGSSCRGAMRGWFHHGVCDEEHWPYFGVGDLGADGSGDRPRPQVGGSAFQRPQDGWLDDAAGRPLGAYYRVACETIVDIQAALVEVGAVFVAANVHAGWDRVTLRPGAWIPTIEFEPKPIGTHAFALVGYTGEGFLIQNSWGRTWGRNGFALLTYADWVEHGVDAWVGVLGAPMTALPPEATSRSRAPRGSSTTRALVQFGASASAGGETDRLTTSAAYQHTLVLGAGGRLVNRFIDVEHAAMAAEDVVVGHTLESVPRNRKLRVLLYATGGLEDEDAMVARIAHLTPWFEANQIHPIFLAWQHGLVGPLESVLAGGSAMRAGAAKLGASAEAVDRYLEVEANSLLARAIWMQRKQDSQAAAESAAQPGSLAVLVRLLQRLTDARKGLELHLASHSAGVLLHGHLLRLLADAGLGVRTASFLAPACSLRFALDHLATVPAATLDPADLHVDLLAPAAERQDPVGAYGQSLLVLMSRALEDLHKTPVLGLAQAWVRSRSGDAAYWNGVPATRDQLRRWRDHADAHLAGQPETYDLRVPTVAGSASRSASQTAHAVFDRRSDVFRKLVVRVRGRKPAAPLPPWLAPTDG